MALPKDARETLIGHAAQLARGQRLAELYRLCEQQKTISTGRLYRIVEQIQDGFKDKAGNE